MKAALLAWAGLLDAGGLSAWMRTAAWAYPVANTVHLLGLVMLIGGIGVVDLRLAGLWRSLPAAELSRALTPVAIVGLALMVASGTLLFASDGPALSRSGTFHWKLGLIVLALANALAFRLLWQRAAEDGAPLPALGRAMALVSLGLWLWAGTLGRLIAYS